MMNYIKNSKIKDIDKHPQYEEYLNIYFIELNKFIEYDDEEKKGNEKENKDGKNEESDNKDSIKI